MQWAYRIRRKVSAALLLTAIFVLVFLKNQIESKYVHDLGDAFASVYADRLVVESYIYRLSDNLFRKKIMLDTCADAGGALRIRPDIDRHNASIAGLIAEYEKTKLTEPEARYFSALKENVHRLEALEGRFFKRLEDGLEVHQVKTALAAEFDAASGNLSSLSGIQVAEGKLLNEQSKKIVAESSLLTQFELGIVIAIGLMIVVLIFESTSVFTRPAGKESLN